MRTERWTAILSGLLAVTCAHGASAQKHACESGVWDMTSRGKTVDGSEYSGAATSTRYCLLDGTLELDEFRALNPDGRTVFVGASFNVWNAEHTEVTTLWVMGGDPGSTLIHGKWEGDELISTGVGTDLAGEFLEKSTTRFPSGRNYQFDMQRSYDGDLNWIEHFSTLDATFRTWEVPALPDALHPMLVEARQTATYATDQVIVILDGMAEVAFTTDSNSAMTTLRFSSRYMGPDRWRSVIWKAGSDDVRISEYPMPAPE